MSQRTLGCLGAVVAVLCLGGFMHAADEGLIARLPLDEGAGATVRDAVGGVTGALHNVEWTKWGAGNALKFAKTDSYVDLGKALKEKITGDFTLSAWVKLTAAPYPNPETNWVILSCEDYDGKPMPQNGFILRIAGDTSQLYFRSSQPGVYQDYTLSWKLENNKPAFVGVVRKGDKARLFLNGLPGPEFPVKTPAPGPAPLLIGGGGQSFNGIIGEVRIYNRALSDEELKDLHKRTAADRAAASADTKPGPNANIALSVNGCWAIASSNANWGELYCSNLIDGNADTAWQSFQPTKEEYVDLKWDFEKAVSRVSVSERSDSRASEMELLAWAGDDWKPVVKKN